MADKAIRKRLMRTILTASYEAGACHLGSALSCLDILIDLYYHRMQKNDIFIFSKASGVSALYAVLADKGIIPQNKVAYYLKNYPLPSKEVPGVYCSTGSLGHGLPISVGTAWAKPKSMVYCLMSDAEVQEGSMWSSLLFARHYNLINLKVIIDRNYYQAIGHTEDIIAISQPLKRLSGVFPIEIVSTYKGAGIDFLENDPVKSHYLNLTKELLEKALCQI